MRDYPRLTKAALAPINKKEPDGPLFPRRRLTELVALRHALAETSERSKMEEEEKE